jgi:hypothetical protein
VAVPQGKDFDLFAVRSCQLIRFGAHEPFSLTT